MSSPRILFVLGKGGVGRSTVAAALGLELGRRGARTLVFEWTIAEPIAPWFDLAPAGTTPTPVAPNLAVATYALHEALRAYFVDHLHLSRLHRRVIGGTNVQRLIEAAPGIAELLFLGTLWWLTTLAPEEAGWTFDRIVVDVPATGHGASILDMPGTLATMGAAGLLDLEIGRVTAMMRDPAWTGAIVVTTPEELAVEETLELVPRVTRVLGRPPLAAVVNRSVRALLGSEERPEWLGALREELPEEARAPLDALHAELAARARLEADVARALGGATTRGIVSLDEQLLAAGASDPRAVVETLSRRVGALL